MKYRSSFVSCLLPALFCTGATACSDKTPYRLAIVLDAPGRQGAQLAAARINATGGIAGHRLELVSISTPVATGQVAVETAERLASDKTILAVIGHTNSSSSLAASQVYNARHVLQLSPTSTAPLYDKAGPYSFRLVPSDVHQGAFLAEQVIARDPTYAPRVAVVFVNNDYGRPLHGVLMDRLHASGVTAVYDMPYAEIDSSGGRDVVADLARAKPQVLVWLGRSADLAPLARRLAAALPSLDIIASDAFPRGRAFVDSARLFSSVQYVRTVDLERADTALQNLRQTYARVGRGGLSDQAILGYDAVELLAEALRTTGARREALPQWLSALGHTRPAFAGLSGPIEFTSVRDRAPHYRLVRVTTQSPGGH